MSKALEDYICFLFFVLSLFCLIFLLLFIRFIFFYILLYYLLDFFIFYFILWLHEICLFLGSSLDGGVVGWSSLSHEVELSAVEFGLGRGRSILISFFDEVLILVQDLFAIDVFFLLFEGDEAVESGIVG